MIPSTKKEQIHVLEEKDGKLALRKARKGENTKCNCDICGRTIGTKAHPVYVGLNDEILCITCDQHTRISKAIHDWWTNRWNKVYADNMEPGWAISHDLAWLVMDMVGNDAEIPRLKQALRDAARMGDKGR